MTTCLDCKHWDRASEQPHGYDRDGRTKYVVDGEWGTCERILHAGSSSYSTYLSEPIGTDPAFLSDGSGYFASLTTRSDFGCTLFEAGEHENAEVDPDWDLRTDRRD